MENELENGVSKLLFTPISDFKIFQGQCLFVEDAIRPTYHPVRCMRACACVRSCVFLQTKSLPIPTKNGSTAGDGRWRPQHSKTNDVQPRDPPGSSCCACAKCSAGQFRDRACFAAPVGTLSLACPLVLLKHNKLDSGQRRKTILRRRTAGAMEWDKCRDRAIVQRLHRRFLSDDQTAGKRGDAGSLSRKCQL